MNKIQYGGDGPTYARVVPGLFLFAGDSTVEEAQYLCWAMTMLMAFESGPGATSVALQHWPAVQYSLS